MRSVYNNYAGSGWLSKGAAKALAKETLATHKHIKGARLS
jgi:hypothetical protein